MSRKSFIITALIINLTICLTLCVVLFTDKDKTVRNEDGSNVVEDIQEDDTTTLPVPTIQENSSDVFMEHNTMDINDNENTTDSQNETVEGETTKIVESQVASETQPITYKNNGETTLPVINIEQETTLPQEPTVVVNGTTATIKSSCNIRSSADVGGNVVGTAGAGNTYSIDTTRCTGNWIAIQLENGTVGYVAASYCNIQ